MNNNKKFVQTALVVKIINVHMNTAFLKNKTELRETRVVGISTFMK